MQKSEDINSFSNNKKHGSAAIGTIPDCISLEISLREKKAKTR
jgi:hypothetical protein